MDFLLRERHGFTFPARMALSEQPKSVGKKGMNTARTGIRMFGPPISFFLGFGN